MYSVPLDKTKLISIVKDVISWKLLSRRWSFPQIRHCIYFFLVNSSGLTPFWSGYTQNGATNAPMEFVSNCHLILSRTLGWLLVERILFQLRRFLEKGVQHKSYQFSTLNGCTLIWSTLFHMRLSVTQSTGCGETTLRKIWSKIPNLPSNTHQMSGWEGWIIWANFF